MLFRSEAALESVQLAERAFQLVQFLVPEGSGPRQLPDASAVRWWVVIREPAQRDRLFDAAPAAMGGYPRAQAQTIGGSVFDSATGRAEWSLRQRQGGDEPAAQVAMRTLGVWLCPAFGEGFTHAVTWWLLGTTETNYSRLPTTVSGAKQQELREPRELLQALRAEVDRKSTRLNSSHSSVSRMPSSA